MKLFKKKWYWYQVKYTYCSKNQTELFHWFDQIGLKTQQTILKQRELKTLLGDLNKRTNMSSYMCNGTLDVEVQCYLGKFPKLTK